MFLALIGTTLSCINTGARVTYAMGRDDELAGNLGVLHTKNLTPHRAIWTLCFISAIIGVFSVVLYFCGGAALTDDTIKSLPHNVWYSFGIFPHDFAVNIPQSLLIVTLTSNFGTFLLYMMSNILRSSLSSNISRSMDSSTWSCRCLAFSRICCACCFI